MELIEQGGIAGLTLQRLAHSLGYVTTAVYRYFDSKDALIAVLQRKAIGDIQLLFESILAKRMAALAHVASPTRSLAAILVTAQMYLDLPRTAPRAWQLVATLLGDPHLYLSNEESRRAAPVLGDFLSGVEALFTTAVDSGALHRGAANIRTLDFWAALHGALCLGKLNRISADLPSANSIGLDAVRSILKGFGATTVRLSAAARALEKAG